MAESQSPSLDQVRARRKAIAEEDAKLARIEHHLLEIADAWRSIYGDLRIPAEALVKTVAVKTASGEFEVLPVRSDVPMLKRGHTKREMIIDALNAPRSLWQTANEIRDHVAFLAQKEVPMSSISPELTALKKNDTISRNDKYVALTLRLEKESQTKEAPTVSPGDASYEESTETLWESVIFPKS